MTDITGSQSKIQQEEARYRSAISEGFATKVGANINSLLDENDTQQTEIDSNTDFRTSANGNISHTTIDLIGIVTEESGTIVANSVQVPVGFNCTILGYSYSIDGELGLDVDVLRNSSSILTSLFDNTSARGYKYDIKSNTGSSNVTGGGLTISSLSSSDILELDLNAGGAPVDTTLVKFSMHVAITF